MKTVKKVKEKRLWKWNILYIHTSSLKMSISASNTPLSVALCTYLNENE